MASAATKKKEERKGGLPPIALRSAEGAARAGSGWFSGGAGGGLFGGSGSLFGGSGLLGGGSWSLGAASIGAKIALALLITALGVGAFGVGRMLAPSDIDANLAAQRLTFDTPAKAGGEAAKLAGNDPAASAMQVIPESLDGKTPEQRAAEQAAKEEAERRAREAAEAAAKAAQAATPAPAAEVAPPAMGDIPTSKKGAFTSKFGALSHFGAGHPSLAGGAGMSGGVAGFHEKPLANGEARALAKAAPKRLAARAAGRMPSGHARGFAFRQLGRANGLSRAGAQATGETSSTLADSAFSNAPIGGQAVTGGGAGTQAVGGAGVQTGGPIAGNERSTNNGTQAPPEAQHKNSSQWQQIAMAGAGALMMGGMLLMYAAKTIQAGKEARKTAMAMPGVTPADLQAKQAALAAAQAMIQKGQMMAMLAAAMGAAAAGVGALLWKQFHQKQYGMIFIAGGALLAALAIMVMASSGGDGGQGQATAATNAATASSGATATAGTTGAPIGAGLGTAAPSAASPAAGAAAAPQGVTF